MISVSSLKLSDYLATIKHVESLAINRRASTVGEINTVFYIQRELAKESIESKIEYFTWSKPLRILIRIIYFTIICYFIFNGLILVVILYYIVKSFLSKYLTISFVKKQESKNIIAKISANKKVLKRPLIIFSAHYDSISAKVSYKLQKILYMIIRILGFAYFFLLLILFILFIFEIFLNLSINFFFLNLLGIFSFIELGIIIPIYTILFNKNPNESTGSIDNASGVAILIELAKLLNKNPLEKIDILFIWCGAEEWGNKGSKKFCTKHYNDLNQEYDLNRSNNINIDMVGTYIGLIDKTGLIKKKMNDNLNDILEISAKRLNIPLTKFVKIIEPKSDHESFRSFAKKPNKEFQVCCFYSDKDSKFIHSLEDTPDKCSSENLNGCLEICYETVKSLDLRME